MNAPSDTSPFSDPYSDKLTIETPEQTALEFPIAGVGSRFLAFGLDSMIQVLASLVVGIGLGLGPGWIRLGSWLPRVWAVSIIVIFFFALYFGYFAFFEAIWNGQTPGKRLCGIRVIKETGRPITPVEAVARNLLRIVDQLPAFYGVGITSVLLSKQGKRLGDFVAGTIVVHERALQDVKPLWQPAQSAAPLHSGTQQISGEELALIEAFLNRRYELDPAVRFRMAEQILAKLKPRLTLPAENPLAGEKLLEALAHERRSSAGYN
ncbi:MAG: RDD family protein [Candidatus Acidiferrales bacterium]